MLDKDSENFGLMIWCSNPGNRMINEILFTITNSMSDLALCQGWYANAEHLILIQTALPWEP
jgi:hypothetical protein